MSEQRRGLAAGRRRASMAQQRGQGAAAAARVRPDHDVDRKRLGMVARAAGKQRPVHLTCLRLRVQMLTCACCALLGRLWDHLNDYVIRLLHPQAHFGKVDKGRGTLFKEGDRGRWLGPNNYKLVRTSWL